MHVMLLFPQIGLRDVPIVSNYGNTLPIPSRSAIHSYSKLFQQVRGSGSLRTQGTRRSNMPRPSLQNSLVVSAGHGSLSG